MAIYRLDVAINTGTSGPCWGERELLDGIKISPIRLDSFIFGFPLKLLVNKAQMEHMNSLI